MFETDNNTETEKISTRLALLIEIALLAVVSIFIWDLMLVDKNIKDFGQWGDFFGGILNPILTFLTFIGLMITIILQQIELKESRVEFKRTADALNKQEQHMQIQGFENTFFKMLELHNNIVENLKFSKEIESHYMDVEKFEAEGREVFEKIVLYLNAGWSFKLSPITIYKSKIQKQNYILGHYFRNLYQILKFIQKNENKLNLDLKQYSNMLRAQLSSFELLLLFLNCFKNVTDKGEFQTLLIRYSFLQHYSYSSIEHNNDLITIDFGNDIKISITYQKFCEYYKDGKSAFDGNSLINKIKCS